MIKQIYYRNKPKEWPYGKPDFIPSDYKVVTMDELVGWSGTPEKVNLTKLSKLPENKQDIKSHYSMWTKELDTLWNTSLSATNIG